MRQVITGINAQDPNMEIVAGVDKFDDGHNAYPVFATIREVTVEADVVIDFSNVSALEDLLKVCVARELPLVQCTNGLSEAQLAEVRRTSEEIAILKSANMSLGVNVLLKLLKDATRVLAGAGFDIEIVEKHHNQKLDAPSGTALAMADSINEELDPKYEYVYDRSTRREKRPVGEIGISAVRGGSIVGDHDVIFAGQDEVVTFSHRAYSRAVFAKGAVSAAAFLADKGPGMYDMADVIEASL
jgi:4-hydroxy-tetrahydrodipicolinate reductase